MNIVLWVLQSLLALIFLTTGGLKLILPKTTLRTYVGYVEDFSPRFIKFIGALELLAAAGLVIPPAIDVFPWLAPLAAIGVIPILIGATRVHHRRGETILPSVIPLVLAVAVVVGWEFRCAALD